MTLVQIEQAKRSAREARRRFELTLGEVQGRFSPGNLAGEAWDGVKEKGADLADGALDAVKKRPAAVSAVLGAFALFLARKPLTRAVGRLVAGGNGEEGIEEGEAELSGRSVNEGVN